jgi:hypothetical protein
LAYQITALSATGANFLGLVFLYELQKNRVKISKIDILTSLALLDEY